MSHGLFSLAAEMSRGGDNDGARQYSRSRQAPLEMPHALSTVLWICGKKVSVTAQGTQPGVSLLEILTQLVKLVLGLLGHTHVPELRVTGQVEFVGFEGTDADGQQLRRRVHTLANCRSASQKH